MAQQTVSQVDRGANPWVVAQLVVAVAVLLLMIFAIWAFARTASRRGWLR